MRKSLGAQTILYPMPVLIIASYDENQVADAMNAAWGGIYDTNQIGICLSYEHKTVQNILKRKAFTVSFADAKHVVEADYLGIVSANREPQKLSKAGLHTFPSVKVDAPVIEEFPVTLECQLVRYDETSGYLIADIVNVLADESVLNEQGKIDPEKLDPITYDPSNHLYWRLGESVGTAFHDGKKLK